MVHTLTTHLNMYVVNRVVPSGTGMRLCTHTHTHTHTEHTHTRTEHTHTHVQYTQVHTNWCFTTGTL